MKALLFLLTGVMNPLTVPQAHVLPVFGCGSSCRVETEQLSSPEVMNDGWLKVKVRQRTWINTCDWETKECRDEPSSGRAGPPVIDLWLFADCKGELFATSKNPDRTDSWEEDVFYREGDVAGQLKFQTVHGNPFMRWAKLCPAEAEEGMLFIQGSMDRFRKHRNTEYRSETSSVDGSNIKPFITFLLLQGQHRTKQVNQASDTELMMSTETLWTSSITNHGTWVDSSSLLIPSTLHTSYIGVGSIF